MKNHNDLLKHPDHLVLLRWENEGGALGAAGTEQERPTRRAGVTGYRPIVLRRRAVGYNGRPANRSAVALRARGRMRGAEALR